MKEARSIQTLVSAGAGAVALLVLSSACGGPTDASCLEDRGCDEREAEDPLTAIYTPTYSNVPAIDAFSPAAAVSGTSLTISGRNLNLLSVYPNAEVAFGSSSGLRAPYRYVSATQITTTVPSRALSGLSFSSAAPGIRSFCNTRRESSRGAPEASW